MSIGTIDSAGLGNGGSASTIVRCPKCSNRVSLGKGNQYTCVVHGPIAGIADRPRQIADQPTTIKKMPKAPGCKKCGASVYKLNGVWNCYKCGETQIGDYSNPNPTKPVMNQILMNQPEDMKELSPDYFKTMNVKKEEVKKEEVPSIKPPEIPPQKVQEEGKKKTVK